MSIPRNTSANLAATRLDHLRGVVLRATMGIPLLRRIYCDRPTRLFVLYVAFCAVAFALSCFIPLWQLLLGPMVFGFAHLGASVRYFHYGAAGGQTGRTSPSKPVIYKLLCATAVAYSLYRAARGMGFFTGAPTELSEWQGSLPVDGVFMIAVLLMAGRVYRASWGRLVGGMALLLPLTACLWRWPFATTGALVLAHNAVGFFYWWRGGEGRDRRAAAGAFVIFVAAHALIFSGALDPTYAWVAADQSLPFAGLTLEAVGQLVFPWSDDGALMVRGVAAYAFGQSVHYYVWLKAIPDVNHTHAIPTSFRQSVQRLGDDWGKRAALAAIYVVSASVALWFVVDLKAAREAYFLIAGFHGYVEIAGLPLLGAAAQRIGT